MLYSSILLLFMAISFDCVSSLNCYSCKDLIIVDYLVTSDTVPPFTQCQLVDANKCMISVNWDFNKRTTTIAAVAIEIVPKNAIIEDLISPMALMDVAPKSSTPVLGHTLFYSCMTKDICNDQTNLKQILHSLVLEDQFVQELIPLLKVVSPFDPKSAACFEFNNASRECPPVDLSDCPRCQTSIDRFFPLNEQVCATCPRYPIDANAVIHSATFSLTDRKQVSDHVQLACQLNGCNSINNINLVYKASKITFDFGQFFQNASD